MAGPASNYGRAAPAAPTKALENDVHHRLIGEDFAFREAYLENLYPWHGVYMATHGGHLWPCVGESTAANHAQPSSEQKALGWKCLCGKSRKEPIAPSTPSANPSPQTVEQET